MKNLLAFIILAFAASVHADVKISQLPSGLAASSSTTDVFPYVDMVDGITKKLRLWDLLNLPPLATPTFTGMVTAPRLTLTAATASTVPYFNGSKQLTSSAVTPTELGYLSGVTGGIQTQLGTKAPIASPTFTGTATTPALNVSGQTASTVPYLDASKNLTSSAVTPTELGYVSGVTSAIQAQLNGKQATGSYITALSGDVAASGPGSATATIQAGSVDNSKVSGSAAIARSKLGTGTANQVVINDGSGNFSGVSPSSTGNYLKSNGTTWASTAPTIPLVTKYTSGSGTHTFTGSPLYVRVRMVGGGGGGGGSGTASAGNGGSGGDSTFGTSLLSAGGGSGGTGSASVQNGGGGGVSSLGTGPVGTALRGGSGGGNCSIGITGSATLVGGVGGNTAFGGGAGNGPGSTNSGQSAFANTGGGGSGAGSTSASSSFSGPGGGGGGFVDAIISGSTLSGLGGAAAYSVGTGGAAGTAGTSGLAGGAGGSGYIEVTEYYQ